VTYTDRRINIRTPVVLVSNLSCLEWDGGKLRLELENWRREGDEKTEKETVGCGSVIGLGSPFSAPCPDDASLWSSRYWRMRCPVPRSKNSLRLLAADMRASCWSIPSAARRTERIALPRPVSSS